MTLEELVAAYRLRANDSAEPPFCSDAMVVGWLNEAQRQACIRGRLLHEYTNDDVCEIALTPGQTQYALHTAVYEITYLCLTPVAGPTRPLDLVSAEWLDRTQPRWRELDYEGRWAIQSDASIRVVAPVDAGDVLRLECYRLPLADMALMPDPPPTPPDPLPVTAPEIHQAHHAHLVDWVLYRAFSVPDAEIFDATRSAQAEADFTRYFGELPDSDLRRVTREDVPHHNLAILP